MLSLRVMILVLMLLGACAAQQPCRTIGIDSETPYLSRDYLRVQLALSPALQGGFVFSETEHPDIQIKVLPRLLDSAFPYMVSIRLNATQEVRQAVSERADSEARAHVVQQVAGAILSLCPTSAYKVVLAAAERKQPKDADSGFDPALTAAPCQLPPLRELSLFSATSSLDAFVLRKAMRREPVAAKHDVHAEIAPATGVQVTVDRRLGTSFWTFRFTTPAGDSCDHELYILKTEDAPKRIARAVALVVAESNGDGQYGDDMWLEPRTYAVRLFGGLEAPQDRPLRMTLQGHELVLATPEGLTLARIPAQDLRDVSTNDFAPSVHSDWDEDLSFCCQDILSATVVGAYVTVANAVSFGRNLARTEHFLDLAWRDGDQIKRMSFKVRGRDAKPLRESLEKLVEAGRLIPSARPRAVRLLARDR